MEVSAMGFLDKLFKPGIGSLKAHKDYESLFAALRDVSLRQDAARALEDLGEDVRWEPFASALAGEDPFVRQTARRMFERLRILDSCAQFLQKWQNWKDGGPGVDRIGVAAAGLFFLRLVEADAIGRRLDSVDRMRHIDLLVQALGNPFIRSFAVKACGNTKEPTTIRPLIALAKGDSIYEDDVLDSLRQISKGDLGKDLDAWLQWAEKAGL
jgi:HEAT repeat protein